MTNFGFICASLLRWRFRFFFTFMTIFISFLLLGLLLPLDRVFSIGLRLADDDRMIVANNASINQSLPIHYVEKVQDIEGVKLAVPFTFFGGYYREPKNQILCVATKPADFLSLIDEITFNNIEHRNDWFDDPQSIIVGRALAEEYDWKVGELISLYSYIYPKMNGSNSWVFKLAGIFDSEDGKGNTQSLIMHYKYFNDLRLHGKNMIGWINVRIDDPDNSQQVALAIDKKFMNSMQETNTATEASFVQEFMNQVGNFGTFISIAITLVFFTLLLVVSSTLTQSVKERTAEFSTIKIMGFRNKQIIIYIMSESLLYFFIGGIPGMITAYFLIPVIGKYSDLLSSMSFWWQDIGWGILFMALFALLVGLFPAIRMVKMSIVDGMVEGH